MFAIGERVVCINDAKLPHTIKELDSDCPNFVKKGKHYTIRGFTTNKGIVDGVWLEEVINPPKYFRLIDEVREPSFRADRFRKLQENEVEALVEELEEVTL